MVDGAHRNMQFSPVIVAEHGGAFHGFWELLRGDFLAERKRRGGLYRARPGGVIAREDLAN
jgi:hypothetical protein